MARVLKRCPKCSRKITNKIECKNCGLLFERYFKAENLRRAQESARAAKKDRIRRIMNGSLSLLLIAMLGGGAFYYFSVRTPAPDPADTSSQDNLQAKNMVSTQKPAGRRIPKTPAAPGGQQSRSARPGATAPVSLSTETCS